MRARRRLIDYDREEAARADRLATVLDRSADALRAFEREYDELASFHDVYSDRVAAIHEAGVARGTAHWRDGKTVYVVCRATRPATIVETGVRFGAFDAHILAALAENGTGELHSLDRPGSPPGPFEYGYLIPEDLRGRWTLHTGDARRDLPDLLGSVGPVDGFLHDSDHRRAHMRFEFETAYDALVPGGLLASHDIRLSSLFDRFCADRGLSRTVVCDTGIARVPRADTGAE